MSSLVGASRLTCWLARHSANKLVGWLGTRPTNLSAGSAPGRQTCRLAQAKLGLKNWAFQIMETPAGGNSSPEIVEIVDQPARLPEQPTGPPSTDPEMRKPDQVPKIYKYVFTIICNPHVCNFDSLCLSESFTLIC
jgi:hypothetical protein